MSVYPWRLSNNFIVQSVQVEDLKNDKHLTISKYCITALKWSWKQKIWLLNRFVVLKVYFLDSNGVHTMEAAICRLQTRLCSSGDTGMLIPAFAMFNSLRAGVVLFDFGGCGSWICLWSMNHMSALNIDGCSHTALSLPVTILLLPSTILLCTGTAIQHSRKKSN